ncbi:MAG: carboxypeptidase regulatory-like domain-containing protein [Planctomycetaceae bacterium]
MPFCTTPNLAALLAAVITIAAAGCSDSGLVSVEGTVTLDGQPLSGCEVIFSPEHGRPSSGKTDASGRYQLRYTADALGSLPGKHTVSISTFRAPDLDADDPQLREGSPERIPAKYNHKSTLSADVQSGRGQAHDFALDSAGEIHRPTPARRPNVFGKR